MVIILEAQENWNKAYIFSADPQNIACFFKLFSPMLMKKQIQLGTKKSDSQSDILTEIAKASAT